MFFPILRIQSLGPVLTLSSENLAQSCSLVSYLIKNKNFNDSKKEVQYDGLSDS